MTDMRSINEVIRTVKACCIDCCATNHNITCRESLELHYNDMIFEYEEYPTPGMTKQESFNARIMICSTPVTMSASTFSFALR